MVINYLGHAGEIRKQGHGIPLRHHKSVGLRWKKRGVFCPANREETSRWDQDVAEESPQNSAPSGRLPRR